MSSIAGTPGKEPEASTLVIRVMRATISLFVSCKDQAEVDELWAKLSAGGGEEGSCGWVKDKFGLWWQIVPTALGELMGDPDRVKAKRVVDAMLKMKKIDVAGLRRAYEG